jgi:hypothetical protein
MIQTKAIQGKTEDDWTFETKDVSVNEVWKQLVDIHYLIGDHLVAQGITKGGVSYVRPVNGSVLEVKIDFREDDEPAHTMIVIINKDGTCVRRF